MMQDAVSPTASDEAVVRVTDRRASFALPGLILAGGALLCAIATLLMLLGLTPVAPTSSVVFTSVVINGMFVLGLMALIAREVARLVKARSRGRAAARLHIRIVALFSIVAITPAILVAIVASLTLNVGLDRWFGVRTQQIISSSQSVAQAYLMENASYLQGQTVSMANDLERNRSLYSLDRTGFADLMTLEARDEKGTQEGVAGACWVDCRYRRGLNPPDAFPRASYQAMRAQGDDDKTRASLELRVHGFQKGLFVFERQVSVSHDGEFVRVALDRPRCCCCAEAECLPARVEDNPGSCCLDYGHHLAVEVSRDALRQAAGQGDEVPGAAVLNDLLPEVVLLLPADDRALFIDNGRATGVLFDEDSRYPGFLSSV